MFSSSVETQLKSYEHFSDLGVEISLMHRHIEKLSYSVESSMGKLKAVDKVIPIFAGLMLLFYLLFLNNIILKIYYFSLSHVSRISHTLAFYIWVFVTSLSFYHVILVSRISSLVSVGLYHDRFFSLFQMSARIRFRQRITQKTMCLFIPSTHI